MSGLLSVVARTLAPRGCSHEQRGIARVGLHNNDYEALAPGGIDEMAKDRFNAGDRVIIDMCRTAMNALNWNGQIGTLEERHRFYKNNWWVKLDVGGRPNFKEESLKLVSVHSSA